jgi:ubiquinone/menaquinone biosynthesis C-methylase UbiE
MLKLFQAYRWGWQGILAGYFTTRSLQALFNVGFFDEMQERGRVRVAAYAAEHDLDEGILQALCESLYALRILRKEGDAYLLDRKGKILVEAARGWFLGIYGYEETWHNLEALLTREKVYGRDFYRRSAHVARGSGEMEGWTYYPVAIDMIATGGYRHVMQLGCGAATFLRDLCVRLPGTTGYGIDIDPEALAVARDEVTKAGVEERIHLFLHDMTGLEPLAPRLQQVDVATLFFTLHELLHEGEQAVIEFLRGFQRLFPGVPLIIFDFDPVGQEAQRRRPGMSIHYLLQHKLSHQRPAGRDEWIAMFHEAGVQSVEVRPLDFLSTTIYTLR